MNDALISESRFLRELLRAVETEPVQVESILGASGIEHSFRAVGVDPGRKRMVVITDARDAQQAALILADLQASFKAVQIVIARVVEDTGSRPGEVSDSALGLGWISSKNILSVSSEVGHAGSGFASALAAQGLLPYFFPAPDHLALALIDRWQFATIPQVVDQLVRAPDAGHPFGPPELISDYDSFTDLIQELQRMGLVEMSDGRLQLTTAGRALRTKVQSQPREALASKLLNRMRASLGFQPIWLPVIRGHADVTGTS